MSRWKAAGLVLALVCTAARSPATLRVQELFDGAPLDATINGQGNTSTTLGLTGTWLVNGTYGTRIFTANNFDVNYSLPGPPYSAGTPGGVYWDMWSGSGGASWATDIYATRPMATAINFAVPQTVYFSVRLNNAGDTAMGLGFASGANGSSAFVGAGYTWDSATGVGGSAFDANNSVYLSQGTLDQALGGNNNGPYAILAHTAAGTQTSYAFLVGRLVISDIAADILSVRNYHVGDTIDSDPGSVAWDLQGGGSSDLSATHLLMWLNGSGQGEFDAIRVGTTWEDVTGIPEPSVAGLAALAGVVLFSRRRRSRP